MGSGTWEIQDPAVSELVYVPGFQTLRNELMNHHQLFWSSLRGMGQPLLGNEVQVAPLFPLTLLTIALPDPLFFHVFCLLRFVLIGCLCLLIGSQVLRMSRLGAFVFMVCFGFAVYVLRWINHGWLNGLLSGLLYMFANDALLKHLKKGERLKIKHLFLLTGAVYCMLTNGFPESALMAAMLSFFVMTPEVVRALVKKEVNAALYAFYFVLCHLTGALLGNAQVLALVEYLKEHGTAFGTSFRAGPGAAQFEKGLKTVFFMVTRVMDSLPPGSTVHFFNLIPLFLSLIGLSKLVRRKKVSTFDLGALLCLVFAIIKLFPTWDWFNNVVMGIPLFKETWFVVYFFTLPIWFVAYFAARGAEVLETSLEEKRVPSRVFIGSFVLVAGLLAFVIPYHWEVNWFRLSKLVLLYAGFAAGTWYAIRGGMRHRNFGFLIGLFLVAELLSVHPPHFVPYWAPNYELAFGTKTSKKAETLLKDAGVSLIDSRDQSGAGRFAAFGLGSMNDGSPAIVTERARRYLQALYFQMDGWGASMPVHDQKFIYSYPLTAVNVYFGQSIQVPWRPDGRRMEKLGLVAGLELWVDRNALPRAYRASGCVAASSDTDALKKISDGKNFRLGSAVVEGLTNQERAICKGRMEKFQPLRILSDDGNILSLSKVAGPGVVVLSDMNYPGWSAKDLITGAPLGVKNANYAFKGVVLPSKTEYSIEFNYTPVWWPASQRYLCFGFILLAFQGLVLLIWNKRVSFKSESVPANALTI